MKIAIISTAAFLAGVTTLAVSLPAFAETSASGGGGVGISGSPISVEKSESSGGNVRIN